MLFEQLPTQMTKLPAWSLYLLSSIHTSAGKQFHSSDAQVMSAGQSTNANNAVCKPTL